MKNENSVAPYTRSTRHALEEIRSEPGLGCGGGVNLFANRLPQKPQPRNSERGGGGEPISRAVPSTPLHSSPVHSTKLHWTPHWARHYSGQPTLISRLRVSRSRRARNSGLLSRLAGWRPHISNHDDDWPTCRPSVPLAGHNCAAGG